MNYTRHINIYYKWYHHNHTSPLLNVLVDNYNKMHSSSIHLHDATLAIHPNRIVSTNAMSMFPESVQINYLFSYLNIAVD